jgi:hypothetical protein
MINHIPYERLEYLPGATSILIAAKPCYLEPITDEDIEDLPSWSGIDTPYVLTINNSKMTWTLHGESGELIQEINYFDALAEAIYDNYMERKDA